MTIKWRGKTEPDTVARAILDALATYKKAHPKARIDAYRQNSVSVRIRIISPEFEGKSLVEREEDVWSTLDELPEKAVADISLLILLSPGEEKDSFANFDFEHPVRSRL